MRKRFANRSRAELRTWARISATSSCGTVDISQMLNVLRKAFQNRGSPASWRKFSSPTKVCAPMGFQSKSDT
jgi:hypothetical protein